MARDFDLVENPVSGPIPISTGDFDLVDEDPKMSAPAMPQQGLLGAQADFRQQAMQQYGQRIGSIAQPTPPNPVTSAIGQAVTGGPIEDQSAPELIRAPNVPPIGRAVMGVPFQDIKAQKQMLRKQLGNKVKFSKDIYDNELVEIDGARYPLNKPGLSVQDMISMSTEGVSLLPAGFSTKIKRAIARHPAAAITSALTVAASDAAARGLGAQENFDPIKTAAVSVGPILGDIAITGYNWGKRLAGFGSEVYYKIGQGFTRKGRNVLEEQVGPVMARQLNRPDLRPYLDDIQRQSGGISSPQDAARMAGMRQRGLDPTAGEAAAPQSPIRQLEQMAGVNTSQPAFGSEVASNIDAAMRQSREALRTTGVENVQRELGGTMTRRGQLGEVLKRSLMSRRDASEQVYRDLYNQADQIGSRIDPATVRSFAEQFRADRRVKRLRNSPVNDELKTLEEMVEDPQGVTLEEMTDWLSDLKTAGFEDKVPKNQRAYAILSNEAEQAMNDGRIGITGPQEALVLYRRAQTVRAQHGQRFQTQFVEGVPVRNIVQRLVAGGRKQRDVEMVDYADAGGELTRFMQAGLGGKPGVTRDLEPLYREMGNNPNSRQWRAFKEEVFLELLRPAMKGSRVPGREVFDGARLRDDWNKALANEDMNNFINRVFTDRERNRIQQYVDDAHDITEGVKRTKVSPEMKEQYRRTAHGLPFLSQSRQEILKAIPFVGDVLEARTQRAVDNILQSGQVPAPLQTIGIPGFVGSGVVGGSIYENM